MPIPTEPIGSIPRPAELIDALAGLEAGVVSADRVAELTGAAIRDTISRFEKTGSPVVSDGEQAKPSFATYPLHGSDLLAPGGVTIPFSDGHTRSLPKLARGPFHFSHFADEYLRVAKPLTALPIKQAVISASALSLLYQDDLPGYPREQFLPDLVNEAESDIRRSLSAGASCVQIDFTEARLSLVLDPSGGLLNSFIDLNNQVLDRFTMEDRRRIGIHTCAGSDQDASHSASVDYQELLPNLLQMHAGRFYIQLAAENDRARVLRIIRSNLRPGQIIFVGVIDPIDRQIESAEEVRERVLEAAGYIPVAQLGTTDDCGFSPFADDRSTSRDTAFAKIAARVTGTRLAETALGV